VLRAIDNLKKLNPAPLANPDLAALIEVANYEDDLEKLKDCDLVIEAIAERMDWKHDLYKKVAPHIGTQRDLCIEHIRPVDHGFVGRIRCRFEGAFLRRAFLQPAALYASGGTDSDGRRRSRRFSISLKDS
jgi:3-hydroxyacyl-CoA dehydrogenase